ncbi:molybdopterin-dependent oxidoreductase, partial [Asanoa sp. NPDC049518]|uniref:molybdopterin-dependent oxidoreductase n=1 Tax=Asanoa sp. NPDC049518 TaxID=3155503 RepID=UPI00343BCF7E
RIHGRVRKEIRLTYAELLARPMIERYVTLACAAAARHTHIRPAQTLPAQDLRASAPRGAYPVDVL